MLCNRYSFMTLRCSYISSTPDGSQNEEGCNVNSACFSSGTPLVNFDFSGTLVRRGSDAALSIVGCSRPTVAVLIHGKS